MATDFQSTREKYAKLFEKYDQQYTGGKSNVKPVTQDTTASKYGDALKRINDGTFNTVKVGNATINLTNSVPTISTPASNMVNKPTTESAPLKMLHDTQAVIQGVKDTAAKLDAQKSAEQAQRTAKKAADQKQVDDFLAERRKENQKAPKLVREWANLMDKFTYDTQVGRFLNGVSQSAMTSTTGLSPEQNNDLATGGKVSNTIGSIIGPLANPAMIPGGINAPYSTPITNTLAGKVGSLVANPAASRIAAEATREAIVGTPISVGQSLMTGQASPAELAKSAALGGGLGAAGGALARGLGEFPIATRAASRTAENSVDNAPKITPEATPELPNIPQPNEVNASPGAQVPIKQDWFTSLFGENPLGISAFNRQQRGISDTMVKNSTKNTARGVLQGASETMKNISESLIDNLKPLERGGENVLQTAEDVSRANALANHIMGDEFVTPEGQVVGEGMGKIFKSIPRGKDRTFLDYLIVKDAQARVPRGERVFDESIKIPNPDNPKEAIPLNSEKGLQARIDQLEAQNPWLPDMSKRWNQFTKNLREVYGVNEGLLSEEANQALVESRPNYIKMARKFEQGEKPAKKYFGSSGQGFTGNTKGIIKKVSPTGSIRKIVDPRKTMAESVGMWVNNAMRNRVGQQLLNNIRQNPEAFDGIARIVPESAEATQKSLKEMNDILAKEGIDGLTEHLNNEYEVAFKKASQPGDKNKNIITVMEKGVPVKVEIQDARMAKAFQGMNPQQLGLVMSIAKMGSDLTKRGATGVLAPVFAAKSAVVDLPQTILQSKGNPVTFVKDYVEAVASGLANLVPGLNKTRIANLAKDFNRRGGGFSYALRGNKELNTAVDNLSREPVLSPRNLYIQGKRAVKAPFKATEAIGQAFENAPRIASMKRELNKLGGDATPENIRKAMQESREVNINYARQGNATKEMESFVPYTNAAIQGVRRVIKQAKDHPVRTLAGVTALYVVPKMVEYSMFHDDPDYQNLPAREKFRNLIVHKNADGTFTKIPMAPEYSAIGASAAAFLDYAKNNDPEAFKGMTDALVNAYTPPLISGAAQGFTQGAEGNESPITKSLWGLANSTSLGGVAGVIGNQSFTGAPIVSQRVAGRSPSMQYDEKTTNLAKWLGDKLNFSPMDVDYLLRQYGGDISRIVLPVFSDMGAGTKQQTLLRNFIVDPVFTNNLTNDYYAGKSRITAAVEDNSAGKPLPSWYSDDLKKYVTSTAKGSTSKQLSILADQKRAIQANKSLSAAEKSKQLREVQRNMNKIYLDVNAKMSAAGVPIPRR